MMEERKTAVSIIIPNWNGKEYLRDCLKSLEQQTFRSFEVIVVDNGSDDGSIEMAAEEYPWAKVVALEKNEGFCKAVNIGIRASKAPYVILLNNDTRADKMFVREMVAGIRKRPRCFSCQAKMLQMSQPDLIDDAGDFYSALGWAFADGKGKPQEKYRSERKIFSSCAGAAIYRRAIFNEIGLFDEVHFAYLEDLDIGYRANVCGYENWFLPKAKVYHVGSGTTGSMHNGFKVKYSARNNVYLIYKNMPWWQIVWNFPFLAAGCVIKGIFFQRKGFGSDYRQGIREGISLCREHRKVKYQREKIRNYLKIQINLWKNVKKSVLR